MKYLLTTAACLAGAAANAGGYVTPIEYERAQEQPVAPLFSWTGPYVGAQIGHTRFKMNREELVQGPDTVIDHPAVTEEIEHPEITEERTTTILHPAETEERVTIIEHPAETEIRETVIEHPAVTEKVKIGEEKFWGPGTPDMVGYNGETGLAPTPDPSHPTGWKHTYVYEEQVVEDAWTETVTETVVIREPWTETTSETIIIREEWTETITETEIVQEAWTETVVIREAWTEVIPGAWSTALIQGARGDANAYGIFGGYRHQFANRAVVGAEINYMKSEGVAVEGVGIFDLETTSIEGQAGYALGRLLPYAAVGYAKTSGGHGGWMAAVGADYAITDRVFVGAKMTHYEYDRADQQTVALRLGLKF